MTPLTPEQTDKLLADAFRAVLSRPERWDMDMVWLTIPGDPRKRSGFELTVHMDTPIVLSEDVATAVMLEAYRAVE